MATSQQDATLGRCSSNTRIKKKIRAWCPGWGLMWGRGALTAPPQGSVPTEVLSGLSRPKTPQAHPKEPKAHFLQPICPAGATGGDKSFHSPHRHSNEKGRQDFRLGCPWQLGDGRCLPKTAPKNLKSKHFGWLGGG